MGVRGRGGGGGGGDKILQPRVTSGQHLSLPKRLTGRSVSACHIGLCVFKKISEPPPDRSAMLFQRKSPNSQMFSSAYRSCDVRPIRLINIADFSVQEQPVVRSSRCFSVYFENRHRDWLAVPSGQPSLIFGLWPLFLIIRYLTLSRPLYFTVAMSFDQPKRMASS